MKVTGKPRFAYIIQLILLPIGVGLLIAFTAYLKVYILTGLFSIVAIIGFINQLGQALTKIEIENSVIYLNRNKKSERMIKIPSDIIRVKKGRVRNHRGYLDYEYITLKCKKDIEFTIDQHMFKNYKELKRILLISLKGTNLENK